MLARVCTARYQLDYALVVERRADDARVDQAFSMMALNAERLSKQISLGALAVAIPLHLFIDPVAGLSVRAAAAIAFAVCAFSARRWPLTPAIVATAAAIAPVGLAALNGMPALNVFYTVILAGLLVWWLASPYPDFVIGALIGLYVIKEAFEILGDARRARADARKTPA